MKKVESFGEGAGPAAYRSAQKHCGATSGAVHGNLEDELAEFTKKLAFTG